MRAKPRTTYVAASPQTWELIRAAYLSGLSAPTVAARFGVSVTALRKRAAREGWTKQAFARAQGPVAAASDAAPAADEMARRVEATVTRHMVPLFEEPEEMARRALGMAARAISEGDGLRAERLARAAKAIRDLDQEIPGHRYFWDDEEVGDVDGRREHMRLMVRTIALHLAEKIAAGQPLPPEYAELRAERAEDLA